LVDRDIDAIMKKKVLIVDDDPVMSFVCQKLLAKHDYETELAPDGEKGLERLATFQPDAVLLDLMMPKVSGTGFLQKLRAQEAFRNLPVIVLTNAAIPTLVDEAAKAGATRILDKSKFNPVAVIELLRAVLHNGPPTAINVMSHGEPWRG
jgi:CheY-like chemotaxis protein